MKLPRLVCLWSSFASLPVLLVFAGCGGSDVAGRPKLYPATGVVTYQGQPVAGATVTFFPEVDQMPSASAKTDASGKYVMQTFEANDGVVAGAHKVSIMKWEIEAFEGDEDADDIAYRAGPPPKALIPSKYAVPTTSGLQVTIEEGGKNEFDFDLQG